MKSAFLRVKNYVERQGPLGLLKKLPQFPRLAQVFVGELSYQWSLRSAASQVEEEIRSQHSSQAGLSYRPLISVILPTYKPNLAWLSECAESVLTQTYSHLELCISDDASGSAELEKYLSDLAARDSRVRVHLRHENGHICHNTNSALGMATGEYLAFIDHDDLLDPRALFDVVKALQSARDLDFLYTDEDKVDEQGLRSEPSTKPEFSREHLYRTMFTGHLSVYDKSVVDQLGGLRPGTHGAQDWDLLLRALELRPLKIAHIPKIRYHWRKHAASTSSNPASKPYAHEASYKVLVEHFERSGQKRSLVRSPAPGFYEWSPALAKSPPLQ